jgi:hypothetical protein
MAASRLSGARPPKVTSDLASSARHGARRAELRGCWAAGTDNLRITSMGLAAYRIDIGTIAEHD